MAKPYTCQCCGKSYTRHLSLEVYHGNNCFDCSFWLDKAEYSDYMAIHQVIINGEHFMLGETDSFIRGFGGREFIIQFFDGRIVETNNLWCQGPIPKRFRSMLPKNAVFLPERMKSKSEKGGAHV
jgi:DNA-directed RNA polymerase subunit RPC12/RpoP